MRVSAQHRLVAGQDERHRFPGHRIEVENDILGEFDAGVFVGAAFDKGDR